MFKKTFLLLIYLCVNQTIICMEQDSRKRPVAFNTKGQQEFKRPRESKETMENAMEDEQVITGLNESDIPLYNLSYEHAPIDIKLIVEWIQRKMNIGYESNTIMLTGQPGTGKSLLAKAIAFKLGRELLFVDTPGLLGKWRNESLVQLRNLFNDLSKKSPIPVLVLDEINALTHNYISRHSDKYETAMALWEKLDQFKNKKDFFFIGTTNDTKEMPVQIQSRFRVDTFEIDPPSFEIRKQLIKHYLKKIEVTDNVTIDTSCNDEFLTSLAANERMQRYTPRDITLLVKLSFRISQRMQYPHIDNRIITAQHIELALAEIEVKDKKLWDFSKHLTPEEESIKLQRELHEDSKKHQQAMHDESYYQQRDYHNASMRTQDEHHSQSLNQQFNLAVRNERFTRENIEHSEQTAISHIDRNERFVVAREVVQSITNLPNQVTQNIPWFGGLLGAMANLALDPALRYRSIMLDPNFRRNMMYPERQNQAPVNQQNPEQNQPAQLAIQD